MYPCLWGRLMSVGRAALSAGMLLARLWLLSGVEFFTESCSSCPWLWVALAHFCHSCHVWAIPVFLRNAKSRELWKCNVLVHSKDLFQISHSSLLRCFLSQEFFNPKSALKCTSAVMPLSCSEAVYKCPSITTHSLSIPCLAHLTGKRTSLKQLYGWPWFQTQS